MDLALFSWSADFLHIYKTDDTGCLKHYTRLLFTVMSYVFNVPSCTVMQQRNSLLEKTN